jgi:hypothetical protein
MLPLRLGTVNANGPQDLIVYALTKDGRVEAANYPNVKVPSGMDVPLYVKDNFGDFYKATFDRAVARENMRAVFVEYAWDMGWCDPCAAQPLSNKELVELGARWIGDDSDQTAMRGVPAFITRLHVRYDAQSFPEDITFLETHDRENFQGRYVPPSSDQPRGADRLAPRRDRSAHDGDGASSGGPVSAASPLAGEGGRRSRPDEG